MVQPSKSYIYNVSSGLHPGHMEVPRLGVELELSLPVYTTATVTSDLSCVCDPHPSSRQRLILNPLSEARDRTRILMDISQVCELLSPEGTFSTVILKHAKKKISQKILMKKKKKSQNGDAVQLSCSPHWATLSSPFLLFKSGQLLWLGSRLWLGFELRLWNFCVQGMRRKEE